MDFTTLIIFILSFILGYFTGVYLPLKFRREDKKPKISIGPFQKRQNYFNITNHGGDILNLDIEITWLQLGIKQTRKLDDFFGVNEDPMFGHSHKCNSLIKGETKKVIHCPTLSDDGKIKVKIQGNDITEKKYNVILILKNKVIQRT